MKIKNNNKLLAKLPLRQKYHGNSTPVFGASIGFRKKLNTLEQFFGKARRLLVAALSNDAQEAMDKKTLIAENRCLGVTNSIKSPIIPNDVAKFW